MSDEYKTYVCSYPFMGSEWGFEISARSHEEAEQRLRAMAWAKVDGELVARVDGRVPLWLTSLVVTVRNWWRKP